MRYFLVVDFGTKVECESKEELYKLFGGKSQMINDNGGVMPDIIEIDEETYDLDDGYDVI